MSEEPASYLGLGLELKGLEQRRQEIVDDPAASYWLKQAVAELWKRDVVDVYDLEVLLGLLEDKYFVDRLLIEKRVATYKLTKQ